MLKVNETRFLVYYELHHESCEFTCGLYERVCKSKQKWNQVDC